MPSPLPESLHRLASELGKLPGIGPRSAERIALHLVQSDEPWVKELAELLVSTRSRIHSCPNCGILTEQIPCSICSDSRRAVGSLCVVERAVDVLPIEKSGSFRGRFHVLGGKISPTDGVGPEDLNIESLEKRIGPEAVKEIILALSTDVEGDATSFYLARRLSGKGVMVSRLAHGLPVGSGLEFADELTLSRALEGRQEVK